MIDTSIASALALASFKVAAESVLNLVQDLKSEVQSGNSANAPKKAVKTKRVGTARSAD